VADFRPWRSKAECPVQGICDFVVRGPRAGKGRQRTRRLQDIDGSLVVRACMRWCAASGGTCRALTLLGAAWLDAPNAGRRPASRSAATWSSSDPTAVVGLRCRRPTGAAHRRPRKRPAFGAVRGARSRGVSHPARTVGCVADKTAIEWTEATWNPTTGCDRMSPGCDHCYALTLSKRLKAMGSPKYQLDGDPTTSGPGLKLTIHPSSLDVPRRWSAPRLIFVNSGARRGDDQRGVRPRASHFRCDLATKVCG